MSFANWWMYHRDTSFSGDVWCQHEIVVGVAAFETGLCIWVASPIVAIHLLLRYLVTQHAQLIIKFNSAFRASSIVLLLHQNCSHHHHVIQNIGPCRYCFHCAHGQLTNSNERQRHIPWFVCLYSLRISRRRLHRWQRAVACCFCRLDRELHCIGSNPA